MKRKRLNTPLLLYIILLVFVVLLTLSWSLLIAFGNNDFATELSIEILKDFTFAIVGSFLIALLIDFANTSKDNKRIDDAFNFLKPSLLSVYDIVATAYFLFKNCFVFDEKGRCEIKYYYNNEFYYKRDVNNNSIIDFKTFDGLCSFVNNCNTIINRIKESYYYEMLDYRIKELLDEISIKRFSTLNSLYLYFNDIIQFPGASKDIERLGVIVDKMEKIFDTKKTFEIVDEEEANYFHSKRIEYLKSIPNINESISKTKATKVYKGREQIL